ncbi:MAG: LuxR C-terminal-related transcriptional regulator [Gammaproteobacteria bacterium]|nr:LuxR C-terminal-related transcriptional regulator [Gammaproteobacteria bacterium]MBU1415694.1 LuxR C-terminal-related transcriptional regulator [Gammaproteobacteria bacterium]
MTTNDAFASISIRNDSEGGAPLSVSLDDDWVGALSRLGRMVMALHRLTTSTTVSDFQRMAFQTLLAELPFDSGIWATGAMGAGPVVHSSYSHNQPPEMMRAWQKLLADDTILAETLKRPGVTLRATADGPEGGPPQPPEVREHMRRFGMEHVLATTYIDPGLGLIDGFSLYRADPNARFTEPERLLVQHALPHMVESWRNCRLRLVRQENPPAVLSGRALGICDQQGVLHTAGPNFANMMRNEWPGWRGPLLPQQWLAGNRKTFVGHRITASLHTLNDLWLVKLRHRSPLDNLTPREIDIARRFGLGLNYQDIAAELHISPATVRNHLTNIYGKLGVANKVELAKLFD